MVLIGVALAATVILVALCLIPGYTRSIKDPHGNSLRGSIASLEKVILGGAEQWILLRGEDTTKPVMLFLHGGPGTSHMGLLRKYTRELERHFVVVDWDQRGAGKSYAAIYPNAAMNIPQFVSDACELSEMLRIRFHQDKIYIVGHSWGSVIGVLAVQKRPELYYAYIGIGQVANMLESERCSYTWTLEQAEKNHDGGTVKKLNEMGMPPYTGDWQKKFMRQRRYLASYGGEVHGNSKGAFPLVLGGVVSASEYNLLDRVNFFRGIFSSVRLLGPELMTVNLNEQAPSLKVPIYFLLGKHDYEAAFVQAEQYFRNVEAPTKELIWFENSAHMLNFEEHEKFSKLLIQTILPATYIH